jgi:ferric-dicitrate binding protein FerR (iron transport regulator)
MDFWIVGFLEPNNPILQKSSNPTIHSSINPANLILPDMNDTHKYHEDEFIGRWIAGELSAEEHREFGEWIQAHPQEKEFFDDLKNLWHESATISLQKGRTKEERWDAISRQVYLHPKSKLFRFTQSMGWKTYAATAMVVILIGGYVWWSAAQVVTITVPAGKRLATLLPDSSEVTLNAESTLRYNKRNWNEKRAVQFEGEGFFKVEPGSKALTGAPFTVKSNFVTTEVLGTNFNLKARGNKVEVACVTGKVSVASNQIAHAPVILTPGLETIVIKDSPPAAPKEFDIEEKMGWMSGILYFQSTPLTEVFAELERQAGVQLQIKTNIKDLTFTGRIETSNPKDALEIICLSSGLSYSSKEDSVFIISK